MRKIITGIVVVTALFAVTQTSASNSLMVGRKVGSEAELYLDGKRLSNVIVIDGKSYAPVREIAEGVGRSVIYTPATSDKSAIINLSVAEYYRQERIDSLEKQISGLERDIRQVVESGENIAESLRKQAAINPAVADEAEAAIAADQLERKAKIAEYQAEIDGLTVELEALKSAK